MTVNEFWRSTYLLPRAALVCAGIAAALNAASYGGLTMGRAGGAFALVHLAIMALGFALFARIAQHHWLAVRSPDVRPDTTPLPSRLVWGTAAALAYLLVLFVGIGAVYGEGSAEVRGGREVWVLRDSVVRALAPGSVAVFDARMLRAFSAAWLFFGLLIALTSHRVEERIRDYVASRRQAAA